MPWERDEVLDKGAINNALIIIIPSLFVCMSHLLPMHFPIADNDLSKMQN